MPTFFNSSNTKAIFFRGLPWLILCLGLLATFFSRNVAQQRAEEALHNEFEFRANALVSQIKSTLDDYEQVLRGGAALFNAAQVVSQQEFHHYVDALALRSNYPGIQSIGYSQWLGSEQAKTQYLAQMRAEGYADYQVHPAGTRTAYSAVRFIEPLNQQTPRAYGYDMYAEPVRRAAMMQARDENRASLSGKVTLQQETEVGKPAGFLLYLPVYRYGAAHDTVAQRRSNIQGWIALAFRIQDMMNSLLGGQANNIGNMLDIEIHDGDTPTAANLMYDIDAIPGVTAPRHHAWLEHAVQLKIGDRPWTVVIRTLPAFETKLENDSAGYITAGGIGISLLVACIVWLLVNGRERAMQLAGKMNLELRVSARQLQESERYYSALLSRLPTAVVVHGPDGAVRYCNAAALHILGLSQAESMAEMAAKRQWRFLHEDGTPLLPEAYPVTQVLTSKSPLQGLVIGLERVQGLGICWVTLNAYPDWDSAGQITQVVVSFMDISERKRAEIALSNINRFYSLLSRANETIVRATNRDQMFEDICRIAVEDGRFVMAWIGLLDSEQNEIIPFRHWGHDAGYLDNLRQAGVLSFNGPTAQAMHTGQYQVSDDLLADVQQYPWRQEAVKRGYLSSGAFPITLGDKVIGSINLYAPQAYYFSADIISLLGDLTRNLAFALNAFNAQANRAIAEIRLQQLNQQLEQRVADRTRQLETANKELESFSYSVSHDLRAPLRSIDGFSDILQKNYAGRLDEKGRDYLGRVRRASQRMGELIDDLLQLARVTRIELYKENVNLSSIVHELAKELQQSAVQRHITWKIADDITVQADGRLIKVVLENLLGNAWKFTAKQAVPVIEFGNITQNNEKIIFVRDNGAGFDMQYAGKLFGAFQRLHKAEEFEGTGIGLATVQRIIHRHGGRIWAESERGRGTTLYFTL